MNRSLIAPVITFGGLAGCALSRIDGPSTTDRTPWELLALLLVSLLLFVALARLLVLLSHRPPLEDRFWFDLASRRVRSRRHRDRLVHSGRRPDRRIDPDAAATDSGPHPPAR